jgi:hypothetical protein
VEHREHLALEEEVHRDGLAVGEGRGYGIVVKGVGCCVYAPDDVVEVVVTDERDRR